MQQPGVALGGGEAQAVFEDALVDVGLLPHQEGKVLGGVEEGPAAFGLDQLLAVQRGQGGAVVQQLVA